MIRQQNKGRYRFIVLFSILEILALTGAFSAHYFTKTRMGMLRHVVYLNGKWERAFPIQIVKWVSICIIIGLIILISLNYLKRRKHYKTNILTITWTMIVNGWTLYFLLAYSVEKNRAYYILAICFTLITLFQNMIYYCKSSMKLRRW